MNHEHGKKRPRDNRHLSAQQLPTAKATHVAASVQQAIQRDPLQALPGEESAQRRHPVMHAIDLLINFDELENFEERDLHVAGRELQEYHAEQMGALQKISADAEEAKRQLSEMIEDVAEMLGFDLTDRTAGEMMEVLRDRLNPPAPLIEPALSDAAEKAGAHLHDVCTVLAKHFGDDPAVTFENAAGLVEHVISDAGDFKEQAAINAREREQLRDQLRERSGVTNPTREEEQQAAHEAIQLERMAALYANDEERQAAVEKGWHSRALLQQVLVRLTQNQLPEGWREHLKTLIESNQRYEAVLATMRNVLSLV